MLAKTDYQTLEEALTRRNAAITTAKTASVVLYNANAGKPNTNANTANHHPARPGSTKPITAAATAAQPNTLK
ncbi:hypothetical protein D3C87_1923460 [compost metagenome]